MHQDSGGKALQKPKPSAKCQTLDILDIVLMFLLFVCLNVIHDNVEVKTHVLLELSIFVKSEIELKNNEYRERGQGQSIEKFPNNIFRSEHGNININTIFMSTSSVMK